MAFRVWGGGLKLMRLLKICSGYLVGYLLVAFDILAGIFLNVGT